jgi:predicted transcriptional regulator
MKVDTIRDLLDAEVVCCADLLGTEVYSACGSDMMSDVLAFVKDQGILLTGLVNAQTVRTAMMMDIKCIVFVRGKKPDDLVVSLAEENGIILMCTDYRMYTACGLLYTNGLSIEGGDKI